MAHCYLPENFVRPITKGLLGLALSVIAGSVVAESADAQHPPAVQQAGAIDPITLEPYGAVVDPSYNAPVHAYVESWAPSRQPRHPAEFRDALRDSVSGFYGGVEYLNLRVNSPDSRIGNFEDLPDLDDPANVGYTSPFIDREGNVIFNEQPFLGLQNPGDVFVTDPFSSLVVVDHLVLNPFFGTEDPEVDPNTDLTVENEGANLLLPNLRTVDFENVPGIRGTVGYQFSSGVAVEANVFGLSTQDELFSLPGGNDVASNSPVFQLATAGRDNLTFIPVTISDLSFDLPSDGIGVTPITDDDDPVVRPDRDTVQTFITNPDDPDAAPIPVPLVANPLNDLTNPLVPLYFDGGFATRYRIDMLGSEANAFIPVRPSGLRGWTFDVSLGARYLNVDEALLPGLTFQNANGTVVTATAAQTRVLNDPFDFNSPDFPLATFDAVNGLPEIGEIRAMALTSEVNNHLYAAQLGFRSELDVGWGTFGIAPKIALGVNSADASVTTSQLFRASDPTVTRNADWSEFAAVFDLGLYAKLHLQDWLHVTVGYQFMLADGVARSPELIDYRTSFADPGFGIKEDNGDVIAQGLNLGFEVLLP